ncbi:MAG: 6,7-dimethyl-8-ribityllumazine synthase [Deltaproteobacteria bacterium]|nr:6,7-dimethyl-8-ribityllumazine synthase [Deltaproteobacteria bacterium]
MSPKNRKKPRIAIIASRFNPDICDGLIQGAVCALKEAGFGERDYTLFRVPGAFEIPLTARRVAARRVAVASKKYRGIICLGAVIRGETPHFDYICRAATDGISRVALDFGIPLAFGVLTTNTVDEAVARSRPDEFNKGREAAMTVLEMVDLLKTVDSG